MDASRRPRDLVSALAFKLRHEVIFQPRSGDDADGRIHPAPLISCRIRLCVAAEKLSNL